LIRILAVAGGGALGALARYGLTLFVAVFWRRDFPLATLLVNVSGSFVLGFFATLGAEKMALDPAWRLFVTTGFLGAFTTFSTFEYETQRLAESGAPWLGTLNVLMSVGAGYAAVLLGIFVARR
jgi:fluoride exporter